MVAFALFILSGVIIATLAVAKRMEEKKRRTPLVLRAVSKGDARIRALHHEAIRQYDRAKDKSAFYLRKQLPLKMKGLINKLNAYAKEKGVEYFGDMRGAKLLNKKPEGISEFFKSISEVEKGAGEINESLPEEVRENFDIEASVERPVEVTETRVETIVTTQAEEKPIYTVTEAETAPAPAAPKKKRTYKKKPAVAIPQFAPASASVAPASVSIPRPRRSKKIAVVEILD